MSGARISPLCAKIIWGEAWVLCSSSNKQTITRSLVRLDTTITFWILCRVSRVHCLTQNQVGWGICLGSEGDAWLTLSSESWDRHQATLSKSTNRNKTVSAHICLTSEPPNRQDVLRGIVQWRSGHKMAQKVYIPSNCKTCILIMASQLLIHMFSIWGALNTDARSPQLTLIACPCLLFISFVCVFSSQGSDWELISSRHSSPIHLMDSWCRKL